MPVYERSWTATKKGRGGREKEVARTAFHVQVYTPGWTKGRWQKTLPKGSTKAFAEKAEAMIRALSAVGAWDMLDVLSSGDYPLPDAAQAFDSDHPRALAESYQHYRQATDADRIDTEEVVDDWLRSGGETADARTQAGYRGQLEKFFEWARDHLGDGVVLPTHFSADSLRRYQSHLMGDMAAHMQEDKTRKPRGFFKRAATANRHFIALSSFGTYLETKRLVETNFARSKWVKRLSERKNFDAPMSRTTWTALYDAALEVDEANARLHQEHPYPGALLWRYLVASGALVHQECTWQLTPSHIHYGDERAHGMIPVSIDGTKREQRDRTVYIPKALAKDLAEHCKRYDIGPGDLIFARPHRGSGGGRAPFRKKTVIRVWYQALGRITGEYPSAGRHKPGHLRHTFGRFQVEGIPDAGIPGVDIMTLKRLMGHSTIKTTQKYLEFQSASSDVTAAWIAARNAGIPVEGVDDRSPERAAADTIRNAAEKAGLDPAAYLRALLESADG